jgi:hypothetical protein
MQRSPQRGSTEFQFSNNIIIIITLLGISRPFSSSAASGMHEHRINKYISYLEHIIWVEFTFLPPAFQPGLRRSNRRRCPAWPRSCVEARKRYTPPCSGSSRHTAHLLPWMYSLEYWCQQSDEGGLGTVAIREPLNVVRSVQCAVGNGVAGWLARNWCWLFPLPSCWRARRIKGDNWIVILGKFGWMVMRGSIARRMTSGSTWRCSDE